MLSEINLIILALKRLLSYLLRGKILDKDYNFFIQISFILTLAKSQTEIDFSVLKKREGGCPKIEFLEPLHFHWSWSWPNFTRLDHQSQQTLL